LGTGDVGGDINLVVLLERLAQTVAGIFFVIDDEDGFGHGRGKE
jgi:hypothetical protein